MKAYLLNLCNGDPQRSEMLVCVTPGPDAGTNPEPDAGTVAEPEADELWEPDNFFLVIAIGAGLEYTGEMQTTQTPVQSEVAVSVAGSSPDEKRVPMVTSSPVEELQTPMKISQLPPPTAPCQVPVSLQYYRQLSSQMCSLHIFTRKGLSHARADGKAIPKGLI